MARLKIIFALILLTFATVSCGPQIDGVGQRTTTPAYDSDGDTIPDVVEETIGSDPNDASSPTEKEKEDYGLLNAPFSSEFWNCVQDRLESYGWFTAPDPILAQATLSQIIIACQNFH